MATFGITESGFVIKTFLDIIKDIEGRYKVRMQNDKYILDFNTPEGIHSEAIGYEIQNLWIQCLDLSNNMSIDTAVGVFLDFFGILMNVPRNPGTFAKGQVKITGNQNLVIPRNTILTYAGLEYFLTENVVLNKNDGTDFYNIGFIQSLNRGEKYNILQDVEFDASYNGINTIKNDTDIEFGTDEEEDSVYRERIKLGSKTNRTATYYALENALLSLENVTNVLILDPETIPSTDFGTVKIYIDGTPSEQIFEKILEYKACGILTLADTEGATTFETYLYKGNLRRKIIYNVIKFKGPKIKVEVLETVGNLDNRYSTDIKNEIIKYVNSLNPGESLYYNKLYSEILGIDEIRKIKLYFALEETGIPVEHPFDTEFSLPIGEKFKINNDNIEVIYG